MKAKERFFEICYYFGICSAAFLETEHFEDLGNLPFVPQLPKYAWWLSKPGEGYSTLYLRLVVSGRKSVLRENPVRIP